MEKEIKTYMGKTEKQWKKGELWAFLIKTYQELEDKNALRSENLVLSSELVKKSKKITELEKEIKELKAKKWWQF